MSARPGGGIANGKKTSKDHGILVCFAVKNEAKHFQPAPSLNCKVIITGIGQENARRSVNRILESFTPRMVLTCGYAGGLNPGLQRGTVVIDTGQDEALAKKLTQPNAQAGRFHCSHRIAVTGAEKQKLWQETRADAVEMESGMIRAACRIRGIATATIRVISDDANTDLPLDFNALAKPHGNISYAKLALTIMKSPTMIPKLMRFQRELDACSRKLAATLHDLLEKVRIV